MSRAVPVPAKPQRVSSASRQPVSEAGPEGVNTVGTTYEMCLALEHDDLRLQRQLRRLVDTIIGQFPAEQGGTLLFAGSGSSSHVADVAGSVARQLTTVTQGSVVLVDADGVDRVLTQRFAATTEKGLAEALQDGVPAGRFVVSTAVPRMAFLGVRRQPGTAARRVLARGPGRRR